MTSATLERTALRLADLIVRGWTVDLARLHGECHNHWYRLPHIENAEASEAWQEDKAYEMSGAKVAYSRAELLDRRWPAKFIPQYLGAPAATHDIASGHEKAIHIWHGRDVARVEASGEFQAAVEKYWKRSKAVLHSKADREVAAEEAADAAAAKLRVSIPFDDIDTLEEAALAHRNARETDPREIVRDLSDVPQRTIDRWVRNYVRHECTAYTEVLTELCEEYTSVRTLPATFASYATKHTDPLIDEALARL